MLTFKQIEALYWTVRLGTFAASAQKLHTTQSAITKRIQELEADFDIALFDRSGYRAELTARGHEIYALAEEMLGHRDRLLVRLKGQHVDRHVPFRHHRNHRHDLAAGADPAAALALSAHHAGTAHRSGRRPAQAPAGRTAGHGFPAWRVRRTRPGGGAAAAVGIRLDGQPRHDRREPRLHPGRYRRTAAAEAKPGIGTEHDLRRLARRTRLPTTYSPSTA